MSIWHPYPGGEAAGFWAVHSGPTSPCPWRVRVSTGPPKASSCLLVLHHDASLAHVPMVALQGGWPKGTPCPEPLFSFFSHPTYITLPHVPWAHTCRARLWVWSASDSSHMLYTNLPSSATLGSNQPVSFLPSSSFLDLHCSSLPPALDGKLSTRFLTGVPGFEFQGAGTGVSIILPRRPSVLLWKIKSTPPVTSFSNSSRGIFAWVKGGICLPWLQKDGLLPSMQLPIRQ